MGRALARSRVSRAFPCQSVSPPAALVGHALPPDVAVGREGDVREDGVRADGRHGVGVGLLGGPRRDAEEARLGVDGVDLAVLAGLDPGDVVADGGHLPALEAARRDQHGEVGLAAGAGEGGRHVGLLAFGRLDAEDEHVLGEPALARGHAPGDAQGEALLPEEGVAAVARAEGPDGRSSGKWTMYCSPCCRARGRPSGPASSGLADGVQAGHELARLRRARSITLRPMRVMMLHVGDHVGRVGELDADVGDGRAQGPMLKGTTYRVRPRMQPLKRPFSYGLHLLGFHPVVGRPRLHLARQQMKVRSSDAGHVAGIGAREVAVGPLFGFSLTEGARFDENAADTPRTPPPSRRTSSTRPGLQSAAISSIHFLSPSCLT
jgi:hypothetical protein